MSIELATQASIDAIERIADDQVMFVCDDESVARKLLKRNPRAKVIPGEDGDTRVAVVYLLSETNLINAVRRA